MTSAAGTEIAQLAVAWQRFKSLCVTGTNGKTTTTSMLAAIVAAAGEPAARFTTLGAWVDATAIEAPPTERLAPFLAAAAAAGARSIAVEVVSLALATGFAGRFPPDIAVFTNLMDDHRKTHGSPDAYREAKAKLFARLRPGGAAVLNAADPASAELARAVPAGVTRLGFAAGPADPAWADASVTLQTRSIKASQVGLQLALQPGALADALGGSLTLAITGAHNAGNALAAAVAAHAAGYAPAAIRKGLSDFTGVPGRFQTVAHKPWVIVDFAHTPDALRSVLQTARAIGLSDGSAGTLTCIFGCGGQRNRERRAPLARVAGALADRVVITTDNPRGEDPAAIATDIERGFGDPPAKASWHRELDRRSAIETAILAAGPDDVVIIAGKGHESKQEVRGRELPWSDVEVARAATARRPHEPAARQPKVAPRGARAPARPRRRRDAGR